MAIDSYMLFLPYSGPAVKSESQVDFAKNSGDVIGEPFLKQAGNVFEVDTYGFDIEQTINMGSQSSGAGAGKVQFNAFSITRKVDLASPMFFQMACQGKTFKKVSLGMRKSSGTESSGTFFLRFDFKLVAVKTMSWSHGDESPSEEMKFEYGALQLHYAQQKADGTFTVITPGGWNKIKNIQDITDADIT